MNIWRNIFIVVCLAGLLGSCGVNGKPGLPPGVDKNQNADEPSPLDPLIQ